MVGLTLFILIFLVLWAGVYRLLPASWRMTRSALESVLCALRRRQRIEAWYQLGTTRLRLVQSYWPVAGALAAGLVIAAATAFLFVETAEAIQARSPRLERIDKVVWLSRPQFRSADATGFFYLLSVIGTGASLGGLALLVATVFWWRGQRHWAIYVTVTAAGSIALNHGLKQLFARSRPTLDSALWQADSYAFPSGHAMSSLAILGGLAYVAMRTSRGWLIRSAAVSLATLLIVAISVSRLYLGVHWISDILAGLAAGMVWLAATSAIHAAFLEGLSGRHRDPHAP